jgi:hypothetical protein
MRKFPKMLGIVVVVAAVLLIGVGVGWLATRKTLPSAQLSPAKVPSSIPPSTNLLPFFGTNSRPRPGEAPVNKAAAIPSTGANVITNWEDKLDDILGSEGEESDKAKKLLAMFSRLPADGQVEVAQHLSNLLPDQDYAALGKLLTDSKLSEEVLDVLIVDVLNRPNSVKLPLLLEVARDAQHPKAAEAKDLLELYLEEDYGTDWNKWQAKLEQWIKDNPD